MSEIKLLPCPFCGGEARLRGERYFQPNVRRNVICKECFSNSGWYKTDEEAIKAWNTRKPMERIIERLEEEKERKISATKTEINLRKAHFKKAIEICKEEGGIE